MRVRLQVLKVYDIDVADDCADPVNSALALPTTEIEQSGTLVEVSTDYAQLVDELTERESEPPSSDHPSSDLTLRAVCGTFQLTLRGPGGQVTSDLHHGTLAEFMAASGEDAGDPLDDQFRYGRYEGAIDALESFILAAALAGLDVEGAAFMTALETTLAALEQFV